LATHKEFLVMHGQSTSIGRRTFLAGATGLAAATLVSQRARAANSDLRVALVGCGGRGQYVVRGICDAGAHISHLCDLHLPAAESTAEFLADIQPEKPKCVARIEEVLADDSVHAVIVATPDHWHSPLAIQACRAGKDVYVEKPHAHNIWESRQLVEAVRKYDRIVQVGTQNRSGAYNFAARDYVRSGKLGDIGLVKVYNLKSGGRFELGEAGERPEGFDWNEWLGPAPERPWHERL
jgi:predicted dehydrogenase